MKLTREFYIPSDSVLETIEDAKVELYRYTTAAGKPGVAMFGGKRSKPDNHYYYGTEEAREAAIERYVDGQRANVQYTAERRATKTNPHTLEVGSILYTSWGYDQTNVDFFKVVELPSKCFVKVVEIGSTTVESGQNQDFVIANPECVLGEPKRLKATADNCVRISDGRGQAWEWDGKPKYKTAYGYGH